MANRILQSTLRKIYKNGDIDTIYLKSRAKDVKVDDSSTMADVAEKVNGIASGATKTEKSSSNGYVVINGTTTAVYVHPTSGVNAGTYNSVTVDKNGHVTKGTAVTDWTGTVSGDSSNSTEAFEVASTRENIKTGEKHSDIFGKIAKFFGDLKDMAFVDSVGTANLDSTLTTFYNNAIQTSNVTESTSITAAGWVADARAIASLQNQINTINSNFLKKLSIQPEGIYLNHFSEQGTVCFKIDAYDYIIPLSSLDGSHGNYPLVRFYMTINPTTKRRSFLVMWYADGNLYTNYIDVDS